MQEKKKTKKEKDEMKKKLLKLIVRNVSNTLCLDIHRLQFCFSFVCLFRDLFSCSMSVCDVKFLMVERVKKKKIFKEDMLIRFSVAPNLLCHLM